MTTDDKFEIDDVTVVFETDKALRVEAPVFDEPQWIPKSQIHDDSEVYDQGENSEGTLIVKLWFAEKREWV